MAYRMKTDNVVWEFHTKNFAVALHIEPEDIDPADSFQFEEDIQAVRNGDVEWFQAYVAVYGPNGEELGADSLGGCAYETVEEFYTSHRDSNTDNRNTLTLKAQGKAICHYFPDMVREAVRRARETVCNMPKLRCA